MSQTLFRGAHEALTFAFRYGTDQSPRTPMTALMQGAQLGNGKGMVGLDGAGQAGLIRAALRHLPIQQQHVVLVRYGDIAVPCPCCGNADGRRPDWLEAVDALSHWCEPIHDLHRDIRRAMVVKAVCRRGSSLIRETAQRYDVAERTMRRRYVDAKHELGRVENAAMSWVEWWLKEPVEALESLGSEVTA